MNRLIISQFCILTSIRDKIKIKKSKVRDSSRFSRDSFNADLSNVRPTLGP